MATISATSKTLIAKVQAGDPVAWEEFYHTYKRLIFRIARLYELTEEDTADLLQNVMFDLWKPGKFRFKPSARAKFRTWLSRIVRNKLIDLLRKRNPCSPGMDTQPFAEDGEVPKSSQDPIRVMEQARFQKEFEPVFEEQWKTQRLADALACLKEEIEASTYRAFCLCNLDGVKPSEVAALIGITENNVYQITKRCLRRLSEIVKELEATPKSPRSKGPSRKK